MRDCNFLDAVSFRPPTTFSQHARTMHHSSRETRTQDIILPGILTRLGESSVVLLAVESWEGKEKMMIATAVIIMFNIRYPYMKKANQIQWYGTSLGWAKPVNHVTVPLQSGDSFADLNSERRRRIKFRHWKLCIFSLHLSGKSMFCRYSCCYYGLSDRVPETRR